jgi:RNA polymerase-binding protein DksA
MEEKQLEICKEKLLKLRSEHLKEIQGMEKENLHNPLREISGNLSGYSQHMAETAADSFEQEKNINLLSGLTNMVKMIDDALHKMEDGSYGICENCGKEISFSRLEAIPYTQLCISCKRDVEKR